MPTQSLQRHQQNITLNLYTLIFSRQLIEITTDWKQNHCLMMIKKLAAGATQYALPRLIPIFIGTGTSLVFKFELRNPYLFRFQSVTGASIFWGMTESVWLEFEGKWARKLGRTLISNLRSTGTRE